MTHIPLPFLQRIHDEAHQNEFLAIDLADRQGVVVLPQDLSAGQQIDLLRKLIRDLGLAPSTMVNPESRQQKTDLDCQVTVEERAQLFNFLQS
jgi:hypothetical protein